MMIPIKVYDKWIIKNLKMLILNMALNYTLYVIQKNTQLW